MISWTIRGRNPAFTQARSAASCSPDPAATGVVTKPSSTRSREIDGRLARQAVVDGQGDAQRLARDQPRPHRR